jgi:hypothetical protein
MPAFAGALTPDTIEKLSFVLIGVIIVASLLIIRSSLKVISKVAMIVVLAGLGVALFQNRVELGRCSQTCSCKIYGQHVDVPHLPFSCDY